MSAVWDGSEATLESREDDGLDIGVLVVYCGVETRALCG